MIKARHYWFFAQFFRLYTRVMLKLHFHNIILHNDVVDQGKPILLIGNHFSWWDGFFAYYLNDRIFHRKFHVMMLEQQLKSRMFLNKAGAFSIRQHAPSISETLRYTRALLSDSANLVNIYPQGAIHSMFDFPVKFEPGILKILKGLEKDVQIIMQCTLVDYFSRPRPTLTFGLKEYRPDENLRLEKLENAFNAFMQEMIAKQKA